MGYRTGSDVMKRIGAPLIGGVFTSFLLELLVYPAIYEVWKWNFELKKECREVIEMQKA
jgi:copper/silver efflux system protein